MVKDFSTANFELKLNGNILPIETIHRETRPRRVVILLDASGSMNEGSTLIPWRQALDSAILLAKLSKGRAHLALLVFNTKILHEIPFSGDNEQVLNRLTELQTDSDFAKHQVQGRTRLNDAMNRALQLLGEPSSADTLYLSSDGEDNDSHISAADLQKKILASGVRIFLSLPVRHATHRNAAPEELNAVDEIASLVHNSGGDFMQITDGGLNLSFKTRPKMVVMEGVKLYFEGLFENQVMQVVAPATQAEPKKQKLTLTPVPSAGLAPGTQFTFPRQLNACSAH